MYDWRDGEETPSDGFVRQDEERNPGLRIRMWIAGGLAVAAIILFAADRFMVLVKPNIDRYATERDLTSVENLERDVVGVLDGYGIRDAWIKRQTVGVPAMERVRDVWTVRIPRDLSVASLNYDLTRTAESYEGRGFAVEDEKGTRVAMHIKFRGTVRYSLLLVPSAEVSRASGVITLLVDGLAEASDSDLDALLATREPVACILEPTRDNVPLLLRLRQAGREIVLHFHITPTQESPSRFALAEDLTDAQLLSHVRFIVRNYPGVRYCYITSERASGRIEDLVARELRARGLQRFSSATLMYIDRSAQQAAMSARMNDLADIAVRDGRAAGVVELRDEVLPFLEDEMRRMRKRGFDFISVGTFLAHMAPS